MRKALALGTVALSLAGVAVTAAPAQAATGTTTVALTVLDGSLAIVPTAVAAGASSSIVDTGRVITSSLGVTVIADTRAVSPGWTFSATTTDFTPVVPVTLVPTGGAVIPASA